MLDHVKLSGNDGKTNWRYYPLWSGADHLRLVHNIFAYVTLHPEVYIKMIWTSVTTHHITGIEFFYIAACVYMDFWLQHATSKTIVSQVLASKEDEEPLTAHTLLISAPLLINNMAISRSPCPQALANGVSSIESDAKFRLTVCRRKCISMVIMR